MGRSSAVGRREESSGDLVSLRKEGESEEKGGQKLDGEKEMQAKVGFRLLHPRFPIFHYIVSSDPLL